MLRWVGPPLATTASLVSATVTSLDAAAPWVDTIRTFARHDWTWFSRLVLEASLPPIHEPGPSPFPVTVVAGSFDAFVDPQSLRRRVEAMPDARLVVLPGSHFLPLQQPDAVHAELVDLIGRAPDTATHP